MMWLKASSWVYSWSVFTSEWTDLTFKSPHTTFLYSFLYFVSLQILKKVLHPQYISTTVVTMATTIYAVCHGTLQNILSWHLVNYGVLKYDCLIFSSHYPRSVVNMVTIIPNKDQDVGTVIVSSKCNITQSLAWLHFVFVFFSFL